MAAPTYSIPNTLVDVLLLIGMDDDTDLQPISKIDTGTIRSVYKLDYEPQVLVAASSSDMVKFFPNPHRIVGYPLDNKLSNNESQPEQRDKGQFSALRPSVSVNPKILARHASVRRPGPAKAAIPCPIPELPISEEVIRSIPSLCFPDGMKLYRDKPENSVHFLVLTDMAGSKTYACCITFSRTFLVEKDDQGYVYTSLETDGKKAAVNNMGKNSDAHEDKLYVYIPHCCITISQYPYYTKMKECLSSMISFIEKDQEELYTFLKEYSHILTNTPVPPAGNVAVELNLNQLPVVLKPPSHPDKPVIDFPLHLVFLCFSVEEFLKIIAYVLQEERLVFLSSNYSLLTVVMESIRNLILPFEWRFTYVTVLPSNGLGYLQAPGTFMFGCHSKHKEEVQQVDGLVLVDIDRGKVTMNPVSLPHDGKPFSVPTLPRDARRMFVEISPKFRLLFDTDLLQRPVFYNLDELKDFQMKKEQEVNEIITRACLELLVNLFRCVISNLRVEQRYFNKEQFLNQFPEEDKAFYAKVITTDMFKQFLEDRMKEKKDYWSDFELKTRDYSLRRPSLPNIARSLEILQKRRSISTKKEVQTLNVFKLPDVTNTQHYVEDCCHKLTAKIKECPDYDDRMSYVYLRAMFNMAAHHNVAAMEDFITLSTSIMQILPEKNLCEVYNRLDEIDKTSFSKRKGVEVLLDIIETIETADEHSKRREKKIRMDPISIPDRDLTYEEFVEYISLQNMSNDYDTTKRLFDALTINTRHPHCVDQSTLTLCVEHWKNNRQHCSQVTVDDDSNLQEEEIILKSSQLIKTDYGLGRISLTDKRLFFKLNVTNTYTEITRLQDIDRLEKSQYCGVFQSAIDTLLIHKKDHDKTVFTAYLKEERNLWYMLIFEMWSGKKVAMGTKDIMAVQQAVQNTLLIDAVIESGEDESTAHFKWSTEAAGLLCYFTKFVKEGRHVLPETTVQLLQTKLDPNIGERERKTVQALLYSGGGDGTMSPKLWCGLSDGKVKVYNAMTWVLEGNPLQTKQCVACLTAMGDGHVWAGSFGIFIIDTETITISKTLMEHQDLVVDIVLYDHNKYVYSASLDGTIIKWDVKTLTMVQPVINLHSQVKCLRSLKIHNDNLYCGSWSSILKCDLKGNVLLQFQAKEPSRVIELDSFTIIPSGQIWAGCRRDNLIYIWDIEGGELMSKIPLPNDSKGVSILTQAQDKMWVGCKDGSISVISTSTKETWKTVKAHTDAVRVLCPVTDRYMVSGGGSKDGKVCIWSGSDNSSDASKFVALSEA